VREGVAAGLMAAAIWSGYLVFARAGVLAGLSAWDIAFFRFAPAGLLFLPWVVMRRGELPFARALCLAVLVGPPFVLIGVGGFAYAPLAHGAALQPAGLLLGSAIFACLLLSETLHGRQALAYAVTALGVLLAVGGGVPVEGPWVAGFVLLGDAMFLGSGLMWALFATLIRRWRVSPLDATANIAVLSSIAVVPLWLVTHDPEPILAASAAMLAGQVVMHGFLLGVVAIIAFSFTVRRLGPARAALFPALVPLLANVAGAPFLDEQPQAIQWLGLALTTAGLALASLPIPSKEKTHDP
jgi:drug/metabolite transporter (DMT)-like permease